MYNHDGKFYGGLTRLCPPIIETEYSWISLTFPNYIRGISYMRRKYTPNHVSSGSVLIGSEIPVEVYLHVLYSIYFKGKVL